MVEFELDERRAFQPKEGITVSQWAERHRIVTAGSAPGLWDNSRTPYLVEVMNAWTDPWVRHVILCFSPQCGKTQTALNCLLYSIDQDPGPAMYIMPDEKVAKRIARVQIIPSLQATPRTKRLMSPKVDDTAAGHIRFTNGMNLLMAWASSPAVLASESVRYLFRDEGSKYPEFSGREADPFALSDARMNAFPYTSKVLDFSTPNIDGDAFDILFNTEPDERRLYHAKCPICGAYQIMRDEKIHAKGSRNPKTIMRRHLARYECENCGQDWDDLRRNQAVRSGRWEPVGEPVDRPRCIAFGPLPSWYSPFISLSKVLAHFFKSKDDRSKYMSYVTQHRAEAWKEVIEPKEEKVVLDHRTEYPPMIVPPDCLALTAGIDVQMSGFWFVVRAWELDLSSHLVLYGHLDTFDDVEALLFGTQFPKHESSEKLPIWRAAMDTGGGKSMQSGWTRTEEIYHWLRDRGQSKVFGIKGSARPQFKRVTVRPVDKIPGGLELRLLDVDAFKRILHFRLGRREGESQRFFLHSEAGMDYAQQFLAEELRRDRKHRETWVQLRRANHLLDCEVYAAAAADSEWTPSFTMIAKQLEMKKNRPTTPKRPPPKIEEQKLW